MTFEPNIECIAAAMSRSVWTAKTVFQPVINTPCICLFLKAVLFIYAAQLNYFAAADALFKQLSITCVSRLYLAYAK